MVSTRKKKHQNKGQLRQLNETLNDFIIGKNTAASAKENETLEPRTKTLPKGFGRIAVGENSVHQDQVLDKNIDDKIRKAIDAAQS